MTMEAGQGGQGSQGYMCDGVVAMVAVVAVVLGKGAECKCKSKRDAASGPAPDSSNVQKAMRTVCGVEHSLAWD
jgi:hypothetical protein